MLIRKGKAMVKSFRKPKQYLKKKTMRWPLEKFSCRGEMRQSSRSDDDGRPFSVSQYCYGFFLERENVKRRLMRRDP